MPKGIYLCSDLPVGYNAGAKGVPVIMIDQSSSPASVPRAVVIGIALVTVAGLGLIAFGLYSSIGASAVAPTPTLPPVHTPIFIPTMTAVPPTPTPTTPPPTEAPAPEAPTPTETQPPPTNAPAAQPIAAPPTDTPAPAPASNLSPGFSVSNPSANVGEDVWFHFSITNPSGTERLSFGFLGVTITKDGANLPFHASWTGHSIGPNEQLNHDDHTQFSEPGTYALRLTICYESVEICLTGQGWEYLSEPVMVEVH
jgi:hypothetical protein